MKKLLSLALLLISILALSSCSPGEDLPDGMKRCAGSTADGYFFYVPEEWLISNVGNIKAAYISRVNTTSVSFTRVELDEDKKNDEYFFGEYFNEHRTELEKMQGFTLREEATAITLGAKDFTAERAEYYVYTYEYPSFKYESGKEEPTAIYFEFSFMQILAKHGGEYYILTYSAQNKADEGVTPNYEKYFDKFTGIIENFKFVQKSGENEDKPEYETDADGYKLISDKGLSGFDFYVPDDFVCDFTSAIVSATHNDGSNINITEATATGVYANQYWEMRKQDLSVFADNIREIEIGKDAKLGNNSSTLYGNWAYSYEYTYDYDGTSYHVYQIIAINGSKGYVFTYTAKEENYLAHLETVKKIIEKVNF